MNFNNMVDSHRSETKFYQFVCFGLITVVGILSVVVPASLKNGPYVIRESESISSVALSEPWKITIARSEGFLRTFLSSRFEWSKENVDSKRDILKSITNEQVFSKFKESVVSYGAIAKSQDARGFYILEGFRFSNEQHSILAQVSRIIRIANTGVVTPLRIKIIYEDVAISQANPYGLRVKAIEEGEIPQSSTEDPQ